MKRQILTTLTAVLGLGVLMVGCKPGPVDPKFDHSHNQQDVSLDGVELEAGSPLDRIGIQEIWKKSSGQDANGQKVVIAMVGTGVDYGNSELRNALWMNAGEMGEKASDDSYDNDWNGYADDVFGYDFYSVDGLPYDWHGHDTFTSSLIFAAGEELIGAAPNAALMSLRYLGPDGRPYGGGWGPIDAFFSIEYAVTQGAKVIYFNWPQGGFANPQAGQILQMAFELADEADVAVVIPAGNGGNQERPAFLKNEAILKMDNVFVVSGLTEDGGFTSTTNYGRQFSLIGAPAEGAKGYYPGTSASEGLSTTSVAAAYTAAAVALLSTQPNLSRPKDIREALMRAADKSNRLDVLSQGSLNLRDL